VIEIGGIQMAQPSFSGFSSETLAFLTGLKENNTRLWFESNRTVYEQHFMKEAGAFVEALGEKLHTLSPAIQAIPKRDKTIFRIHRDTRFSGDKRPFKTHMALFFWEGPGKKMENSGFYFHLEPDRLFLGTGIYLFPSDLLHAYREAVVDPKYGEALEKAVNASLKGVNTTLGWKKYKRTPHGFDPSHPRAEYLLYGGLGVQYEEGYSERFHSPEIVDYVFDLFKGMALIHFWIRDMTIRHAGI
jgi:uncharacterized protein (TIGR02453 family)